MAVSLIDKIDVVGKSSHSVEHAKALRKARIKGKGFIVNRIPSYISEEIFDTLLLALHTFFSLTCSEEGG
jgi:hypothetical protein